MAPIIKSLNNKGQALDENPHYNKYVLETPRNSTTSVLFRELESLTKFESGIGFEEVKKISLPNAVLSAGGPRGVRCRLAGESAYSSFPT